MLTFELAQRLSESGEPLPGNWIVRSTGHKHGDATQTLGLLRPHASDHVRQDQR